MCLQATIGIGESKKLKVESRKEQIEREATKDHDIQKIEDLIIKAHD